MPIHFIAHIDTRTTLYLRASTPFRRFLRYFQFVLFLCWFYRLFSPLRHFQRRHSIIDIDSDIFSHDQTSLPLATTRYAADAAAMPYERRYY